MISRSALLASCALASVCIAQSTTVVIPAANARIEGNSLEAKPFASDRSRLTQLLNSNLVKVPFGKRITEIAYRRDKTALPNATLGRRSSASWSIRLGNLNRGVGNGWNWNTTNPSGLYLSPGTGVNNTLTQVYNAVPSWPLLPPVTGATAPFTVRFKLQRPFVYSGPHGLAIDHFCYATTRGNFAYYLDAVRSAVDTGKATNYGKSCPADANRAYAVPTNPGGERLDLQLFEGPVGSAAVAILGGSRTNWGPFKLPLALDGAGLRGCSVYASLDVLFPMRTLSNGSARLQLVVPANRAFAGLQLWTQWMLIDRRVNPSLPLAFSNGNDITLGRTVGKVGLGASFVYGLNLNQVVRGRWGLVDRGVLLVTQLTYQ